MKNLNPNLDATTNIEVPLQDSIRILGLDSMNNVIEITSIPLQDPDGNDGTGDMDGGDLMDGDGMDTNTPIDPNVGVEFCYDIAGRRSNINPCYDIGSLVIFTDQTETVTGSTPRTTINTEVVSIDEEQSATPATPAARDCNGFLEGEPLPYSPFREYWEWEIGMETIGDQGASISLNGIDWPWEFPNQATQFMKTSSPNLQFPDGTAFALGDQVDYLDGARIYGRFHAPTSGWASAAYNDAPVGATLTIQTLPGHGSITMRKVRTLTSHPAPQRWVHPAGFSINAIYPPFSAGGSGFGSNCGSVTRTSGGTAETLAFGWWPTEKLDGTSTTFEARMFATPLTAADDLNAIQAVNGAVVTTGSGQPTQSGPFGLRWTGVTATSNGTNFINNAPDPNSNFTISTVADGILRGTISDPTRAQFCADGGTMNGVGLDGGDASITYNTRICVSVTEVTSSFDNYMIATDGSVMYDVNPICSTDIGDEGDTSDGMGGIDTRTCARLKVTSDRGIRVFSTGTTQLVDNTDLTTNPTISTVEINTEELPALRLLTNSTTLTDVEDGTITLERDAEAGSVTIGYSSAALNGDIVTLAGDSGQVTNDLQTFTTSVGGDGTVSGEFAFINGTFNPITTIADLNNIPTYLNEQGATGNVNDFRWIRLGFDNKTAAEAWITDFTGGALTSYTGSTSISLNGEFPLTITNGANTATFLCARITPGGNPPNDNWFVLEGTAPGGTRGFRPSDLSAGAGSFDESDLATWTFTSTVGGFGNLTVTNGSGTWSTTETIDVCLDGEGGDGNFGGDLGVGGDLDVGGDIKLPSITDNTIPVKAANDCLVDSAIASTAGGSAPYTLTTTGLQPLAALGATPPNVGGVGTQSVLGGTNYPNTPVGTNWADITNATRLQLVFSTMAEAGAFRTSLEAIPHTGSTASTITFNNTATFRVVDSGGGGIDLVITGESFYFNDATVYLALETNSYNTNMSANGVYTPGAFTVTVIDPVQQTPGSTTVEGDLTVTGETTLDSNLTGLLRADAGVVSVGSAGVSGLAGTIPVFEDGGDGVGNSIISQTSGPGNDFTIPNAVTLEYNDTLAAGAFRIANPTNSEGDAWTGSQIQASQINGNDNGFFWDRDGNDPRNFTYGDTIAIYVDDDNYVVVRPTALGLGNAYNVTRVRFAGVVPANETNVQVGIVDAAWPVGTVTTATVANHLTVTGDLTVTGTVTGNINNTNTTSPTPFQFWAGTQTEFDNQYGTHDMAGAASAGGGFTCSTLEADGSCMVGNLTASSQGAEDTTGVVAYLIRG